MENQSQSTPPRLTYEQYRAAPRITLAQLLACFPAYEAFKTSPSKTDSFPYDVRVFEIEKFIYVIFGPDRDKIAGAVYGGGITYVVNKETNLIISTMVMK